MKFAYADPPYLGLAKFYVNHHPEAMVWDDPETHRALIARLSDEYPDGWALSLHQKSMRVILPMCPEDCRIGAWVKPFCSYKLGVHVAYAWEPVIFRGGRKKGRDSRTVRDWVSCNMAMRKGLVGAKPEPLFWWIFELLGADPGDELDDLFPGTGVVGRAWELFIRAGKDQPLFA